MIRNFEDSTSTLKEYEVSEEDKQAREIIEENFEVDQSFEDIEEDLDEGYSYNQNISRPEHTPEVGGVKSEQKKKTPKKQELTDNIAQKLNGPNYQTHDIREESRNKGLKTTSELNSQNFNVFTQNKSASSLVSAQSFNDRMRYFETKKQNKAILEKEKKNKRLLKE